MTDFTAVRDRLGAVSPSFCLAKWHWVTLHLGLGETHSCYHPPMHAIDPADLTANPSALHNTAKKKLQRKAMLDGQRPEECSYCWNIEDLGPEHISDRIRHSSGNLDDAARIAALPWDADVNPRTIEVSFSNHCNLMCSYCSPGASSRWQAEVEKFGSYPVRAASVHKEAIHPNLDEDSNPFITAFWRWLPEVYPTLHFLRVTGGEPLLSNAFFRMADYVAANPNPNLHFYVNTNLNVPDARIDRMIAVANRITADRAIKEFRVYTSCDTWGPQAEYIRHGLNLATFERNLRRVLNEIPGADVSIMVTFNVLALFNFPTFVGKIAEWRREYGSRLQFDPAICTYPSHFDPKILPETFQPYFDRVTRAFADPAFTDADRSKWATILQHWVTHRSDPDIAADRADFHRFFAEHDRRRKTALLTHFPELAAFYRQCET